MARKVKSSKSMGSSKKIRPALTPEARELLWLLTWLKDNCWKGLLLLRSLLTI